MLAALAMQLTRAEAHSFSLWKLWSPFIFLALPTMLLTASLALLFETLPGLRGGVGNVLYFFLWTGVLALGATGGAYEAFRQAKEKGWTRFIGVTGHHDPAVLQKALDLYEFDTVLLPVNPAEPHHASFLPLAREALARGLGVIGMKVLCRGNLPQLAEDPEALAGELVAYALSQAVSLVVIGADNPDQVRLLAAAARKFVPMTPEEQQALEAAVAPHAIQLMYYKP
jgi:aryl-alcohol dehydrogenase-like predicted oxidoreductase